MQLVYVVRPLRSAAFPLPVLPMTHHHLLSWSSMAASSMMTSSVWTWRTSLSRACHFIFSSQIPTWLTRLISQVGKLVSSPIDLCLSTLDMGAVGLSVIDPHFVRESNIEDCVTEALGQVRIPGNGGGRPTLLPQGWPCYERSSTRRLPLKF